MLIMRRCADLDEELRAQREKVVVPWSPVIPVKVGPFLSGGGDTRKPSTDATLAPGLLSDHYSSPAKIARS